MKRNKKDTRIQFIKEGGGSLDLTIGGKRRIIKPNEKFYAEWSEVPLAFRDVVVPVDGSEAMPVTEGNKNPQPDQKAKELEKNESAFEKQHLGGGWYNVVDSEGNVWNEEHLKKDEADELIQNLETEEQ